MLKVMDFYHLQKIKKIIIGYRTRCPKTASKKVVHKAAEATGEFIGIKITDNIVKPKHVINENPRNVEEITISPEKREEILNELRQVF